MTPARFALLRAALDRRQPDLTVLTERTKKSHNVSAIMRTCDAVAVLRVHAISDDPHIKRHHMVSGGSKKWVQIQTHSDAASACAALRAAGFRLFAAHLSDEARDFRSFDYTQPTALILGTERYGVSEVAAAQADEHVHIPMLGMVESLNVSVAAAVILYEAQRQRIAAAMYDQSRLSPEDYRTMLFEWCYPEIAERCRAQDRPYPALDQSGQMTSNPLRTD